MFLCSCLLFPFSFTANVFDCVLGILFDKICHWAFCFCIQPRKIRVDVFHLLGQSNLVSACRTFRSRSTSFASYLSFFSFFCVKTEQISSKMSNLLGDTCSLYLKLTFEMTLVILINLVHSRPLSYISRLLM